MLQVARRLSVWLIGWGMSPCRPGSESIASRSQYRGRTPDPPSPDPQSCSMIINFSLLLAPPLNTTTKHEQRHKAHRLEQMASTQDPRLLDTAMESIVVVKERSRTLYSTQHNHHHSCATTRRPAPTSMNKQEEKWEPTPPPAAGAADEGGGSHFLAGVHQGQPSPKQSPLVKHELVWMPT